MTTIDLVISTPMPAGTVLTLDTLTVSGDPVPLSRIQLDEPARSATFESVDDSHAVLSVCISPGDSSAFTSDPFFKVGTVYVENRPFAAPETLRIFRVVATDRHPRTGGLVAFGFGRVGVVDQFAHEWHRVSMDASDFDDEKWVEYCPAQPDGTGEGPDAVECPPDCSGCVCAALGTMAPCSHCTDNHRSVR